MCSEGIYSICAIKLPKRKLVSLELGLFLKAPGNLLN